MYFRTRFVPALWASGIHLLCSMVVAVIAALLVFFVWYPYPYGDLSGGRTLFFLVVSVDVVCGPLLTLVLFNKDKPRAEFARDLGLVVLIQLLALAYGIVAVWQARPLFLVHEIDRFKVIAAPDVDGSALAALPRQLLPTLFSGPVTVSIRDPKDLQERSRITFESVVGGRDYAERPKFYIAYDANAAQRALMRARPLPSFLQNIGVRYFAAAAFVLMVVPWLNTPTAADDEILFYLPVTKAWLRQVGLAL